MPIKEVEAMIVAKKVGIIDLETGQILEPVTVYLYGKPRPDRGFVKVFNAFLDTILEDEALMKGPYKLLLYIMSKKLALNSLEFHMDQESVCRDLDISIATYKRWVSTLVKKGYIVRLAKNIYKLRPYTAIVGTMADVKNEDF